MSDRDCRQCIYYAPVRKGFSCGKCEYPVPEWIKISGVPFVAGVEGKSCQLYKSPQDVYEEADDD